MVLTDTLRSFGKVPTRLSGHWHPGPSDSAAVAGMIQHVGRLARGAAWPVRSGGRVPGWAVASAALSPVLLTAGWLVAGALQPASYDPIRKTVSVLAGHAGTDRWIMTGTLFLVGGCHLVTAGGLAGVRVLARVLLIVAGMASIGIAASPEPVVGSTPQHVAWTALGAVTIAVWPAFVARRASPRPLFLSTRGSAAVTVVFVALLGWLVIETQGGSDLGLAERLSSSVQTSWPFIVAVALRRSTSRSDGQLPDGPLPDGPLPDGPLPDGELLGEPLPDGELLGEPLTDGPMARTGAEAGPGETT
jgi:Protein of unknown function (DUF998)